MSTWSLMILEVTCEDATDTPGADEIYFRIGNGGRSFLMQEYGNYSNDKSVLTLGVAGWLEEAYRSGAISINAGETINLGREPRRLTAHPLNDWKVILRGLSYDATFTLLEEDPYEDDVLGSYSLSAIGLPSGDETGYANHVDIRMPFNNDPDARYAVTFRIFQDAYDPDGSIIDARY